MSGGGKREEAPAVRAAAGLLLIIKDKVTACFFGCFCGLETK
jgi:hypothetical protein